MPFTRKAETTIPSALLTIAVFLLTLALMLTRPHGLHEAWAAVGGGLLMILRRLETWRQAWRTVAQGSDVLLFLFALMLLFLFALMLLFLFALMLLFLFALMLLSALLDASGFFEWAAIQSARLARGSGQALFRNVFLLGALITAFLSLDTTAIILTPVVLTFVSRLNLKPMPFLIACAFVANTGSLLLPVSNLTNLLFQSRFHLSFAPFALHMLLLQAVAVAVNYLVLRWLFRKDITAEFSPQTLPDPASVVPDQVFFRGAVAVLGTIFVGYFVGYFVGSMEHIPPYMIALAGCGVLSTLGVFRRRVDGRRLLGGISWALFPCRTACHAADPPGGVPGALGNLAAVSLTLRARPVQAALGVGE